MAQLGSIGFCHIQFFEAQDGGGLIDPSVHAGFLSNTSVLLIVRDKEAIE